MNRFALIIVTTLFAIASLLAQDKLPDRANNFNFGFQLNNYQQDFGLGLQLTSPYFAHGWIAIRGRANFMLNQHLNNDDTVKSPSAL